jgi:hypothetical protein
LTKWLNPSINVLYALSATLGEGVGLVCLGTSTCLSSTLSYLFSRLFHQQNSSLRELVSFFRCVSLFIHSHGLL